MYTTGCARSARTTARAAAGGANVAGLLVTASGYAWAQALRASRADGTPAQPRRAAGPAPVRVLTVELVQALASGLVVSLAVLSMGSIGVTSVGVAYLAGQLIVAAILPSLQRLLRTAP